MQEQSTLSNLKQTMMNSGAQHLQNSDISGYDAHNSVKMKGMFGSRHQSVIEAVMKNSSREPLKYMLEAGAGGATTGLHHSRSRSQVYSTMLAFYEKQR